MSVVDTETYCCEAYECTVREYLESVEWPV